MKTWFIHKTAEEFGLTLDAACDMRIRSLLPLFDEWGDYISERTDAIPAEGVWLAFNEVIDILKYKDEHRKMKQIDRDSITDAMIERARNVPIESLVEFQNGKATAWCHDDKTPSLTHYKAGNRAVCWPCDNSYNPIDVLIERDNFSFISAVKKLCS